MRELFYMSTAALAYIVFTGILNQSDNSENPEFKLLHEINKQEINLYSDGKIMYSNQLTGYLSGKKFQDVHQQEVARFTSFGELENNQEDQLITISEDGSRANDQHAEYKWQGNKLYKNGNFTGYQLISAKNEEVKLYALATYYLIQQQQLKQIVVQAKINSLNLIQFLQQSDQFRTCSPLSHAWKNRIDTHFVRL